MPRKESLQVFFRRLLDVERDDVPEPLFPCQADDGVEVEIRLCGPLPDQPANLLLLGFGAFWRPERLPNAVSTGLGCMLQSFTNSQPSVMNS